MDCQEPVIKVDGGVIAETVKALEPHYVLCDRSDRPDNIVSCYPKVESVLAAQAVIFELMLPGKFTPRTNGSWEFGTFFQQNLERVWRALQPEIEKAIPFRWIGAGESREALSDTEVHKEALEITKTFLGEIPQIREALIHDITAAYNGDPSMLSYAEVKLASPGLMSVVSHRVAHALFKLNVPLIPRIMSEATHASFGVDIHPGAQIGRGFFIDHATGVVIGETAEIGEGVKLYQGVTIGAKSFPLDENGNPIKQIKRHPTLEDGVVVYANATILGGKTVIGKNSTIGGNIFLTKSVPPNSVVTFEAPEPRIKKQAG